jgi:dolichyl-phosphate-mannose--protein O-mannosyl transferase
MKLTLLLFSCFFFSIVLCKQDVILTCGSIIKLKHKETNTRLHSHNVPYGTGSGQQSVTGYPGSGDSNSYWIVKGPHGHTCTPGTPIKNKEVIRLEHSNTGKNLHSHLHQSPLSQQQEVSCFQKEGDTGDNFRIVLNDEKEEFWKQGKMMKFQHVDTGKYLHTHNIRYRHPIPGQTEVTCFHEFQNRENNWMVVEGIFYPNKK